LRIDETLSMIKDVTRSGLIFFKKQVTLAVIFLLTALSACNQSVVTRRLHDHPAFTSFQDIPGVTEDEIRAIEALREKKPSFIYGMMPCTEAFIGETGEIGGFTALFCKWLSQLFEIPFKPLFATGAI